MKLRSNSRQATVGRRFDWSRLLHALPVYSIIRAFLCAYYTIDRAYAWPSRIRSSANNRPAKWLASQRTHCRFSHSSVLLCTCAVRSSIVALQLRRPWERTRGGGLEYLTDMEAAEQEQPIRLAIVGCRATTSAATPNARRLESKGRRRRAL